MRLAAKAVILATAGTTAAVPGGLLYGTANAGATSHLAAGQSAARPRTYPPNWCIASIDTSASPAVIQAQLNCCIMSAG